MFAPRLFAPSYFPPRYFPHGSNTAAAEVGTVTEEHRFHYAQVPSFQDMAEVQRFLQRAFDDIARTFNSVRSVADGGTGIESLDAGEFLAGGDTPNAFTRVKGNTSPSRKFLVSQGNGVVAGVPFWDTLQAGDVPTTGNRVLVGADLVKVGTDQVTIP